MRLNLKKEKAEFIAAFRSTLPEKDGAKHLPDDEFFAGVCDEFPGMFKGWLLAKKASKAAQEGE